MALDQRATAGVDAFAERTGVDLLMARPWWYEHARCRGFGTDAFVPRHGSTAGAARAVCRQCPVVEECLAYALDDPELLGCWGGTTERERRAIRRGRRAS